MSSELLQTSYSKLKKKKDEFEIACVSTFCGIILNIPEPKPNQIEKVMRVYTEFHSNAKTINPLGLDDDVKKVAMSKLIQIFSYFNNPEFAHLMDNYKHLLPFLNWAQSICELKDLQNETPESPLNAQYKKLKLKLNLLKELPPFESYLICVQQEIDSLNELHKKILRTKYDQEKIIELNSSQVSEYQNDSGYEFSRLMANVESEIEVLKNKTPKEKVEISAQNNLKIELVSKKIGYCGFCSWFNKKK